ncbi:MAG TPA: AMIN domain-containing protein, partial [Terriglobales bacterium]
MRVKVLIRHVVLPVLLAYSGIALGEAQGQPSGAGTVVTQVTVQRESRKTVVRIETTGSSNFQMQQLSNPIRFVLDFPGAKARFANRIVGGSNLVRTVRVAQFQRDIARVVIDLGEWVAPVVNPDRHGVTLEFEEVNASAGENAAPPAVSVNDQERKEDSMPAHSLIMQAVTRQPEPVSRDTGDTVNPTAIQPSPDAGVSVSVENGLLTLHARDQLLGSILDQISEKADCAIIAAEGVGKERISIDLQGRPLAEALRQMLTNYDVVFFYSAGN